ncbi:Gfo/Idh/MocA family protein [uncultured Amnibacterium sp.]|uniref:Gfo/Idh/MocA family protein n=1 Tax=uncultured Amnibacterium sp. TaxID=1631851 RepID=UPI0035CC9FC8
MTSFFPEPGVTPLRGGPVLRWGVLGPGDIARAFTRTLHRNTDQRVVAVGSRSADRAAAFAVEFDVPRSSGSSHDLVQDDGVDIVYVAAPHTEHLPLALLAIQAGKHVLVEKPLATCAADGRRIADAARAAGVFAGEAMWTQYLPQSAVLRQVIDRGDLGDVRLATADVGWGIGDDPAPRMTDPALAGGTVLDAGVYGFWFAQFAIGVPLQVRALGTTIGSGVEDQAVTLLRGEQGRAATVSSTMAGTNTGLASITGTRGTARFLDPFVFPARFAVRLGDDEHVWTDPTDLRLRDGLAWQATAIAIAITDGLTDSPVHPLDAAIDVLRTIDAVRAQVLGAVPEER